ncbi:MAG: serpin family protein [Bradymonadia bacterium]
MYARTFSRFVRPGLLVATLAAGLAGCGEETSTTTNNEPQPEPNPNGQSGFVASSLEREQNPEVVDGDLETLVKGQNAFAIDLFHQVRGEHDNLFFSPLSIHQALGMTWAGARNQTEADMANTLHFDLDQDRLHPAANLLDLELSSRGDVPLCDGPDCPQGEAFRLNIVNRLWGQAGFGFLDAFLDTLAVNYGAGLQLMDFKADPEACREEINGWVEDQTEERIKDLLPTGSITPSTRLVLTNAIYFKASWSTPFTEGATQDADFTLDTEEVVKVPTMNASQGFMSTTTREYDAVRLPYFGEEMSMLLVAPAAGLLDDFEDNLTAERLASIVGDLQYNSLDLFVPKFTFETDLPLTKVLKAMGMEIAFSSGADFSGMDGDGGLAITDVLHKAFVGIDEEGTEAAAATAVVVGETSAPVFTPMRLDRPFLFFIMDDVTGAVIFMGRMADPR